MSHARPLPAYLIQRFHGWKATTYHENKAWYRRLAASGQHPRAMVISCCDSRVHVTSIFGADEGEFFIHRNIASLVPPYNPDGEYHGTSAAVEFAVTSLGVAHIVVLGHSNCGGVKGCHDMCCGAAPELLEKTSFVGRWMDILRPGYQRVEGLPADEILQALENGGFLYAGLGSTQPPVRPPVSNVIFAAGTGVFTPAAEPPAPDATEQAAVSETPAGMPDSPPTTPILQDPAE